MSLKYSNQVIINKPIQTVIELFDSVENLKEWQPGLISFDHISGVAGQEGAKSRLKYKMGKREIEMIETITRKNLPQEFSGTYEAKNVWNEVKNFFEEKNEGQTLMRSESEFRFTGIMKLFGWIMPGAFKKESQKFLEQFRQFVENHE